MMWAVEKHRIEKHNSGGSKGPPALREAGDHPSRLHALWKVGVAEKPPFSLCQLLGGYDVGEDGWLERRETMP